MGIHYSTFQRQGPACKPINTDGLNKLIWPSNKALYNREKHGHGFKRTLRYVRKGNWRAAQTVYLTYFFPYNVSVHNDFIRILPCGHHCLCLYPAHPPISFSFFKKTAWVRDILLVLLGYNSWKVPCHAVVLSSWHSWETAKPLTCLRNHAFKR